MAIRIVCSPSEPNRLELVLDKEKEGDQAVATEEGVAVLLIGPDLVSAQEGFVVDCQETPFESSFLVSPRFSSQGDSLVSALERAFGHRRGLFDRLMSLEVTDRVYIWLYVLQTHRRGSKLLTIHQSLATLRRFLVLLKNSGKRRVRDVRRADLEAFVEHKQDRGLALSIRGIQKRMEHYAKKTGLNISCHHLRHTMATQMLNADAQLLSIQALLGHSWITTTQRYCRVSNPKVERDYHRAMQIVMKRTTDTYPQLDQKEKS